MWVMGFRFGSDVLAVGVCVSSGLGSYIWFSL